MCASGVPAAAVAWWDEFTYEHEAAVCSSAALRKIRVLSVLYTGLLLGRFCFGFAFLIKNQVKSNLLSK